MFIPDLAGEIPLKRTGLNITLILSQKGVITQRSNFLRLTL
ncbi:Uncharacterized protein dnm_071050 [Desulfonema magnum]|uniref:Uncharacterized protein n=1 Tax=Desulfonema magnum TaxID=45655 RepID=A0A975BSK6_9BACT|nr:Uncharacterized protein dnm_071050 [Desulfonema magnum]